MMELINRMASTQQKLMYNFMLFSLLFNRLAYLAIQIFALETRNFKPSNAIIIFVTRIFAVE
jgi:hypothetical protein